VPSTALCAGRISAICPTIVLKLAVNSIHWYIYSDIVTELTESFFRSFQRSSDYDRNKPMPCLAQEMKLKRQVSDKKRYETYDDDDEEARKEKLRQIEERRVMLGG